MEKDTYKYFAKLDRKILHRGITYNLNRREAELVPYLGSGFQMVQKGKKTTYKQAFKWLKKQPWEWR